MNWRRRRQATEPRSRSARSQWRRQLVIAGLIVVALLGGLGWWRGRLTASGAALPPQLVPVTRGDLTVTVESSGSVRPARSVDLGFAVSGQVTEVLVAPGQNVKQGQLLARLDDAELKLALVQAEADLSSAQAALTAAREGSVTAQGQAEAEAVVIAAEANLTKTRTGNVTAADIANAEAAVRAAEANLRKVRSAAPADLADAEAAVRAAEANLAKTRSGNYTAEDLAEAEAAVRTAEARVREIEAGATPAEASAAELAYKDAQTAYDAAAAAASLAKTNAEREMNNQAEQVRGAQDAYSSAYWAEQQARSGIDPQTGRRFEELGKDAAIEQRSYAEALREAERLLRQAETALQGVRVAYEQAQQAEVRDVAAAQAKLNDARVQYETALQGARQSARVEAQAQLDQARARRDKIRNGGTAADIAAAQAQLDQARQAAKAQSRRHGSRYRRCSSAARPGLRWPAEAGARRYRGRYRRRAGTGRPGSRRAGAAHSARGAIRACSGRSTGSPGQRAGRSRQARARSGDPQRRVRRHGGHAHYRARQPGRQRGSAQPGRPFGAGCRYRAERNRCRARAAGTKGDADLRRARRRGRRRHRRLDSACRQREQRSGDIHGARALHISLRGDQSRHDHQRRDEVESHAGVLQVPSRAVRSEGPFKTVQVVPAEGQAPVTIKVTTGPTNGAFTEIVDCVDLGKQCLREGDQLALPAPTGASGPAPDGGDRMFFGPMDGAAPAAPVQRRINE